MVVVLQLDNLLMNTLLTHNKQLEVATQFSVVITREQELMLQMQLNTAFWSAWLTMIGAYFAYVMVLQAAIDRPDTLSTGPILLIFAMTSIAFILTNLIVSAVIHFRQRDPIRFSCIRLVCWVLKEFGVRLVYFLCFFIWGTFLEYVVYAFDKKGQAGYGDTEYEFKRFSFIF